MRGLVAPAEGSLDVSRGQLFTDRGGTSEASCLVVGSFERTDSEDLAVPLCCILLE